MRGVFVLWALIVIGSIGVLGFRGQVSENRPWMLIPDMDFQPRYESQAESPFFADGRTNRTPPAGTVAFGGGDYYSDSGRPTINADYARLDDAYYRGKVGEQWLAKSPEPITLALLERGQERYNVYCAVCHGATGRGNGITTQYGLKGVANYHDARLVTMADGEIYNTIANGKGTMMGYGAQIKPRDRWAIVAYLRALQRAQNAKLSDVPEQEKSKQ